MANNNHFLKFRVENFKRFDEFELDNLGQFNLIVGDNNVGKSSVLEALMFDRDQERFLEGLFYVLYQLKHFYGLHEWFMIQYLRSLPKRNPNSIKFEAYFADNSIFISSLVFKNDRQHHWVGSDRNTEVKNAFTYPSSQELQSDNRQYDNTSHNVPYIPFQLGYSHDITDFYSKNIQTRNSRKEQFLKDLTTILPDITNLEINTVVANQPIILISRKRSDSNLPLGTYGDGVVKLFRILIEMQIHAGKRLMIDEIDTGIHFSRMKLFWKTVILSARNNDVQLFATTHSDECIECFKEALDETTDEIKNDSRIVHLEEVDHTSQQVKAITFKFNEFANAVINGNELR
jgi:AAA15 family ATPase/GTPase